MNSKIVVVSVAACSLALLAVLDRGRAASVPAGPVAKIGVVSMRDVFKNCKKHNQYSAQAMARQSRIRAQLDDLKKDVEAQDAELKSYKQGTPDYMQQMQILFEKRSKLQAQTEFIKQQSLLEDKKWLEDLYQAFARATQAIAKEKGLDLVLERTEPEFPVPSDELMTTLYMHKVLYSDGCIDLTSEVTTRLDADETLKP